MALVESIARQQKMSALMLTVFKENTRAMSFYKNKLRCETLGPDTQPAKSTLS